MAMITPERDLEESLVTKLRDLKYEYRPDIHDRATLEANFRKRFRSPESGHTHRRRVPATPSMRSSHPTCTKAARSLRHREAFIRADGTPLNYTLVNIKDWCKNHFEVVNQLRINTDNSHHRYDVMLLINGVPVVQIELKTLGISPRRAMEQIVDYKNDPGNGYIKTLLCFVQLFIVSNRTDTWYFANNNARHFAFDADELFLPIYQFADEDNTKITHLDDFADRFLRQVYAWPGDQQVHGPHRERAEASDDAPVPDLCRQGHRRLHRPELRQRLHLAHDRLGQDAHLLQGLDAPQDQREHPQVPLRRRPQGPRPPDPRGVQPLPGKLRRGKHQHRGARPPPPVRRLRGQGSSSRPSRSSGLALDANSKHDKQNIAQGRSTFKQRLEHLRDKRMVFIFDECHRSQFGRNHMAIKEFFPNSQLFGFTGNPDL